MRSRFFLRRGGKKKCNVVTAKPCREETWSKLDVDASVNVSRRKTRQKLRMECRVRCGWFFDGRALNPLMESFITAKKPYSGHGGGVGVDHMFCSAAGMFIDEVA